MALRVSVVVTGFGLGKCCCCGALLASYAFVVAQSVPIFPSVKFYSFVSPGIPFKKATSYGELLSEFYLYLTQNPNNILQKYRKELVFEV